MVSVLVRPRTAGMAKPVGIMISNSRIVSLATKLTPFARIGGDKSGSKGPGRRSKDSDLSDDEELEKIQLEQGKGRHRPTGGVQRLRSGSLRNVAQRAHPV